MRELILRKDKQESCKPLVGQIKGKSGEGKEVHKKRNKKGDLTTDLEEMKRIMRNCNKLI